MTANYYRILIVLIFISPFTLVCQSISNNPDLNTIWKSPPILSDQKISNSSSNNLHDLIIPLGITGLSFLLDNSMRVNSKKENNLLMGIGHEYGDFYYAFGFSSFLYLTQFITTDKSISITGKSLMESLLVGSIASISIKYILGRSRPYREKGNYNFNWFETKNIKNSLPSGHVITAFITSTVLSKTFHNTYISILLYGLAGCTAYQRIASDNHWLSDTVIGAFIGILAGEYFYNLNKSYDNGSQVPVIVPFYFDDQVGLSINYSLP